MSRLLYLGFAILLRVLPHTSKMFSDKIVNSHHFPDRFWTRLSRNSKILLKRTLNFPPENIIVKSSCISPFFPSHFLFIYSLRRCVCRCQIVLCLYTRSLRGSVRTALFSFSPRVVSRSHLFAPPPRVSSRSSQNKLLLLPPSVSVVGLLSNFCVCMCALFSRFSEILSISRILQTFKYC